MKGRDVTHRGGTPLVRGEKSLSRSQVIVPLVGTGLVVGAGVAEEANAVLLFGTKAANLARAAGTRGIESGCHWNG